MTMVFIFGGLAIVLGLWFATVNPTMFALAVFGVAVYAGLNDWRNKP